MKVFVSGIGTDVGKTFISALLVHKWQADYWKPIQTGLKKDSDFIRKFASSAVIHPGVYHFKNPVSPHQAAEEEDSVIDFAKIILPNTTRSLVVEGAGGLLVPLNKRQTMLDLMIHLTLPVVLVSKYYLGSINHTLLSLELLKHKQVPIAGVIFNGIENIHSKNIIGRLHPDVPVLGSVQDYEEINLETFNEACRFIQA